MKNKDIKIFTGILNAILFLIYVSLFIVALLYYNRNINQLQAIVYFIIIFIIFVFIVVLHHIVENIQNKRK